MEQKNADWHRADVVAALKQKGWSVRALSIASGLAPDTLRVALQVSYPKGERIIAAAIGVKPEEIWPNRYAARAFKPSFPKVINGRLYADTVKRP